MDSAKQADESKKGHEKPRSAKDRFGGAIFVVGSLLVALVAEFLLPRLIEDSSVRNILMTICCNAVVALSLNVINGMAGQFSIGHAGFMALGAYTAALIVSAMHTSFGGGTLPPTSFDHDYLVAFGHSFAIVPVALLAGALVAALFGLLVGLPSLRLRGDYLAIVTLGFAEILRLSVATTRLGNDETVGEAVHAIGGPNGFFGPVFHVGSVFLSSLGGKKGYSGPDGAGVPLYAGPFWVIFITALVALVAWRLKFSGWGRALRALREDEIASEAVGVDPTRYKVTSFVISAFGGGLAGALYAIMRDGNPVVQPDSFTFQTSFDAITMVIIGGSGSVTGAILGAVFVTVTVKLIELVQHADVVQNLSSSLEAHGFSLDLNALRMMIYAGVIIALMVLRPEGVFGEREPFFKKRMRTREGAPA